jgi:glycosyltransferase involved in cell wall biosynthesis
MPKELPVVAAIPNYNMGNSLRRLLRQVLAQCYDGVFVLDDASTDRSVDVVSEFGDEVTLLRSPENRGAGANRNQILDHVDDRTIIHFIDADMELKTAETPAVAREMVARYANQRVGLIGGLISRVDGSQEYYNYGAVFSLWGNFTLNFQRLIDNLRGRPRLAGAVQRVVAPILGDWPNVLEPPAPAPAYWVAEGNMLVHSGIFRSVGGYDPIMRAYEIADLAIRLEKLGVRRQFDPSIRVIHHSIDVRGKNRNKYANRAMLYVIRKHGLIRFLTDR